MLESRFDGLWSVRWETDDGRSGYGAAYIKDTRFYGGDSERFGDGWFKLTAAKLFVRATIGTPDGQGPELDLQMEAVPPALPSNQWELPNQLSSIEFTVRRLDYSTLGGLKVTLTKR